MMDEAYDNSNTFMNVVLLILPIVVMVIACIILTVFLCAAIIQAIGPGTFVICLGLTVLWFVVRAYRKYYNIVMLKKTVERSEEVE